MEAPNINVQDEIERERENPKFYQFWTLSRILFFSGLTFYLFLRLPFFLFVDHKFIECKKPTTINCFFEALFFFPSFGSQSLWKKILTLWSKVQLIYQTEVESELFKGQVKYIRFSIDKFHDIFVWVVKVKSQVHDQAFKKILTHLQSRLD